MPEAAKTSGTHLRADSRSHTSATLSSVLMLTLQPFAPPGAAGAEQLLRPPSWRAPSVRRSRRGQHHCTAEYTLEQSPYLGTERKATTVPARHALAVLNRSQGVSTSSICAPASPQERCFRAYLTQTSSQLWLAQPLMLSHC